MAGMFLVWPIAGEMCSVAEGRGSTWKRGVQKPGWPERYSNCFSEHPGLWVLTSESLVQLVCRQYNFLTYCLTESCSSLVDGITGCVRDSSLQGQRIICRFLSVTLAGKGQMMETSVASQNRNICQACALIHIPAQGSHALAFRRPMLALDFNHPPVIKVEPIPVPLSVPPTCHMFINKTKWLCVTQRALQVGV